MIMSSKFRVHLIPKSRSHCVTDPLFERSAPLRLEEAGEGESLRKQKSTFGFE